MATLNTSCALLTYEQPFDNELGRHGVAFPVGLVLWIDGSNVVSVVHSMTSDQIKNDAKAGSGDFGKAIFRRGLTYTITAGEKTIIDAAGYSSCTA